MTAHESITPSWEQRSRLRQVVEDAESGRFRPFHSISAFAVDGELDLPALDRAWRRLQQRHWVVLTSFDPRRPAWRLEPAKPADLILIDPPERGDPQDALIRAAEEPFDLERGPLARLIVVPVSPRSRLLGIAVDHLVCDAWSRGVLVRDLRLLYDEERGHRGEGPPPLPSSTFADFVVRQNEYLESVPGKRLRQTLTRRFEETGLAAATTPEPRSPGGRTRRLERRLDEDFYDRLLPVAKSHRMTRLHLMLAALQAALAGHSRRFSVATTMTVANRTHPDVHDTVGWYASQVVVPGPPPGGADPQDFLPSFQRRVGTALDAARVPWAAQVADAAPAFFPHPYALPEMSFNAQSARMRRLFKVTPFTGTELRDLRINLGRQEGALRSYWVEEDGLRAVVRYRYERYTERDIAALWQTVAENLERFVRGAGS